MPACHHSVQSSQSTRDCGGPNDTRTVFGPSPSVSVSVIPPPLLSPSGVQAATVPHRLCPVPNLDAFHIYFPHEQCHE